MVMDYTLWDTHVHMLNHYKRLNSVKSVVNTRSRNSRRKDSFLKTSKSTSACSISSRYSTPTFSSARSRLPESGCSSISEPRKSLAQAQNPRASSVPVRVNKTSQRNTSAKNCKTKKDSVSIVDNSDGVCKVCPSVEVEKVAEKCQGTIQIQEMSTTRLPLLKSQNVPEYEYLQFSLRITEDIIRNDLYTNNEMQRVFNSHIEANRGRLDMTKMTEQINALCAELNLAKRNSARSAICNCPTSTTSDSSRKEVINKIINGDEIITDEEIKGLSQTVLQEVICELLLTHEGKKVACACTQCACDGYQVRKSVKLLKCDDETHKSVDVVEARPTEIKQSCNTGCVHECSKMKCRAIYCDCEVCQCENTAIKGDFVPKMTVEEVKDALCENVTCTCKKICICGNGCQLIDNVDTDLVAGEGSGIMVYYKSPGKAPICSCAKKCACGDTNFMNSEADKMTVEEVKEDDSDYLSVSEVLWYFKTPENEINNETDDDHPKVIGSKDSVGDFSSVQMINNKPKSNQSTRRMDNCTDCCVSQLYQKYLNTPFLKLGVDAEVQTTISLKEIDRNPEETSPISSSVIQTCELVNKKIFVDELMDEIVAESTPASPGSSVSSEKHAVISVFKREFSQSPEMNSLCMNSAPELSDPNTLNTLQFYREEFHKREKTTENAVTQLKTSSKKNSVKTESSKSESKAPVGNYVEIREKQDKQNQCGIQCETCQNIYQNKQGCSQQIRSITNNVTLENNRLKTTKNEVINHDKETRCSTVGSEKHMTVPETNDSELVECCEKNIANKTALLTDGNKTISELIIENKIMIENIKNKENGADFNKMFINNSNNITLTDKEDVNTVLYDGKSYVQNDLDLNDEDFEDVDNIMRDENEEISNKTQSLVTLLSNSSNDYTLHVEDLAADNKNNITDDEYEVNVTEDQNGNKWKIRSRESFNSVLLDADESTFIHSKESISTKEIYSQNISSDTISDLSLSISSKVSGQGRKVCENILTDGLEQNATHLIKSDVEKHELEMNEKHKKNNGNDKKLLKDNVEYSGKKEFRNITDNESLKYTTSKTNNEKLLNNNVQITENKLSHNIIERHDDDDDDDRFDNESLKNKVSNEAELKYAAYTDGKKSTTDSKQTSNSQIKILLSEIEVMIKEVNDKMDASQESITNAKIITEFKRMWEDIEEYEEKAGIITDLEERVDDDLVAGAPNDKIAEDKLGVTDENPMFEEELGPPVEEIINTKIYELNRKEQSSLEDDIDSYESDEYEIISLMNDDEQQHPANIKSCMKTNINKECTKRVQIQEFNKGQCVLYRRPVENVRHLHIISPEEQFYIRNTTNPPQSNIRDVSLDRSFSIENIESDSVIESLRYKCFCKVKKANCITCASSFVPLPDSPRQFGKCDSYSPAVPNDDISSCESVQKSTIHSTQSSDISSLTLLGSISQLADENINSNLYFCQSLDSMMFESCPNKIHCNESDIKKMCSSIKSIPCPAKVVKSYKNVPAVVDEDDDNSSYAYFIPYEQKCDMYTGEAEPGHESNVPSHSVNASVTQKDVTAKYVTPASTSNNFNSINFNEYLYLEKLDLSKSNETLFCKSFCYLPIDSFLRRNYDTVLFRLAKCPVTLSTQTSEDRLLDIGDGMRRVLDESDSDSDD